jgi:hypothetical protein
MIRLIKYPTYFLGLNLFEFALAFTLFLGFCGPEGGGETV